MLDLKFVRNHPEKVREMLRNRGNDLALDAFEALDQKRREGLQVIEDLRHRRNTVSDDIAAMKRRGEDASTLIREMKALASEIKEREKGLPSVVERLNEILMVIPNIPHDSVPIGKDSADNPVLRTWGAIPRMAFEPLPHWDIGERLGILDFSRAARLAGARFALYRGLGARLERALINFMLDVHTRDHGYTEVLPPFVVNAACMTGTGQLPKFKQDLFKIEGVGSLSCADSRGSGDQYPQRGDP